MDILLHIESMKVFSQKEEKSVNVHMMLYWLMILLVWIYIGYANASKINFVEGKDMTQSDKGLVRNER